MTIKKTLFTFFVFTFSLINLIAQATVTLTVNGATTTTNCTDPFGNPADIQFQVNVQGEGAVTYPEDGACYTSLPNVQYSNTYTCAADIPLTVNVCFRVFENDGFFGCNISASCSEEICQDFSLPINGNNDFTLALPSGGSSGGTLDFNITIDGTPFNPTNDEMCTASDLGVLTQGVSLGDANVGGLNNSCSMLLPGELSPCEIIGGIQCNQNGVWYSFTTGPESVAQASITALSDPQNTGNAFPIHMAVFELLDADCSGNYDFIEQHKEYSDFDASISLNCLSPNTTYYIMVDGPEINGTSNTGEFGLEVVSQDYPSAPDFACDAIDMGTLALGGSVGLPQPVGNQCGTTAGDPGISGFGSQNSVWFSFSPSNTGHVLIEATSIDADPINLQIALYQVFANSCNGPFLEVESVWNGADFDEILEASCLDPDLTYWILIDGENEFGPGFFDLTVTDAGFDFPITNNVNVECAGGSVSVGPNVYTTTGMYSDTLSIGGGCFEIINTDLTVLEELVANLEIIEAASGEFEPDGSVNVSVIGGDGNYSFEWSNNTDIPNPSNLLGGLTYCVTVTDGNDCEDEICFNMPYIDFIFPTVTNGSVDCFGDSDGEISFFVENGFPPYTFQWTNVAIGLTTTGTIANEEEVVQLTNLEAGTYSITVSDNVMDTIFQAVITQPDELIIDVTSLVNASCYSDCDGSISLDVQGGTAPYTFTWSNGENNLDLAGLCAGDYSLTVTDGNNCIATEIWTITEPEEFILTSEVLQNVSCFQGNDGAGQVTSNGNPTTYLWSTGDTAAAISGQSAGEYFVTVTNEDGCQAISSLIISEPSEPVSVNVEITQSITCNGDSNAALQANVNGAGTAFTYNWSTGQTTSSAEGLTAGVYTVTVENELGCTAQSEIEITQPDEIIIEFTPIDITCVGGEFSGELNIDDLSGGLAPYDFSIDNQTYNSSENVTGLAAGAYTLQLSDALGCVQEYDFSIAPPPEVTVDLGRELEVRLGETISLSPNTNSENPTYQWTSSQPLPEDCQDADCDVLIDLPTGATMYSVLVTDTVTLCSAEASLFVRVNKERFVFFPTAFSPNDDGVNDKFLMYGQRGVEQVNTLQIYDRNGGQVFANTGFMPDDTEAGWDGTARGQRCDTGVYVWFAEILFIDGETEIFKGSVTLVK